MASKPETFERTVCACDDCRAHCKRQPGALALDDVVPIVAFSGAPAWAVLRASIGSVLGVMGPRGPEVVTVGSITPATVGDTGRCIFLDADERCTIHPVAPFGCRMFDAHQPEAEANRRAAHGVREMIRPEYQRFRATLLKAKTWRGQPVAPEQIP